jgi:hypothetical protein
MIEKIKNFLTGYEKKLIENHLDLGENMKTTTFLPGLDYRWWWGEGGGHFCTNFFNFSDRLEKAVSI